MLAEYFNNVILWISNQKSINFLSETILIITIIICFFFSFSTFPTSLLLDVTVPPGPCLIICVRSTSQKYQDYGIIGFCQKNKLSCHYNKLIFQFTCCNIGGIFLIPDIFCVQTQLQKLPNKIKGQKDKTLGQNNNWTGMEIEWLQSRSIMWQIVS